MSRRSIDPALAAALALVDQALEPLPEALAAVTRQPSWRLADVRWTPGEGCRLAYRVETPDGPAKFVAIAVSADGWSQHDYRDDPRLPGARHAADPSEVAARLASVEHGGGLPWSVEPVRYRPGSRCVWRYSIAGGDEGRTRYAKVFLGQDFPRQLALLDVLEPARRRRLVPRVEAVWPDLHVIVSEAAEGRALSAVLADGTVSVVERGRLLHRLGSLLADFHQRPADDAPPFTCDDQLAAMAPALDAVRRVDPQLGERCAAVIEALARSQPPSDGEVLGHGAFRAGQAIVSRGDLLVIDTDGASRCDAARDLGRALAHLWWQRAQERGTGAALAAERAVLDGYATRAVPVQAENLRWWRTAALIQLAARRYSRVEHDAWPDVPRVVDEAERLLATPVRRPARAAAPELLDVDVVSTLVQPVLAPDRTSARPIRVVSAYRVATRSRRRVVVRYRVSGLSGSNPIVVIGKAFADDDHAQRLHTNMRLLAEGPFASSPLRVPRPLGLVPGQRLVLWEASDGVPLDQITPAADAEQGVRRAARWLARLHASNVVLPRRFSVDEEAASTRGWAMRIGLADRSLAERARRLAEGWVTAIGVAGEGSAPIHKDFHPGHVLIGDDTSVIDLDEARQGDPAFDIAHFRTYLQLMPADGADARTLDEAFIDEYSNATGWTDTGTLDGYRAYAWLKIAKQWVSGSGPGQGASRARRLAGAAEALSWGERCLHA